MKVLALTASGTIALTFIPFVLGHGYIVDPAPTWKDGYAVNGWGSSIDNNMWGAIDYSVYGYGTDGTVAFWKAKYDASGYESLGQYIETNQVMYSDEIDEQCGYTTYDDSARQTMPSTNLTYTGFTHPGPCEVWCDDTVVLFDYNCQSTYPDIPAGIPYDESLCADANRFTIYWLGVHGAPWQVFTDCVWLDGRSGSGSAPSPVMEVVASTVATAPPTTSSGSTVTATTAYPDSSSSTTTSAKASTTTTTTAPATTTEASTAASSAEIAAEASATSTSATSTATDTAVSSESDTTPSTTTSSSSTVTTAASTTSDTISTIGTDHSTMNVIALIATGAAVLVSMPAVQGHAYIVDPAAQWADGYPNNGYGSTIDNEIWGVYDNSKYGYGVNGTLNFFKDTFPSKGYDSLGAFISKNQELYSSATDADCGLTVYKDSARSELPASKLTYSGFTHTGPCEVWCDDTKVLFDYDCQTKYPDIPATMSYDESLCANANRLTIYWIGLHGDPWQVYTDCVWLEGGSGSGSAPTPVGAGASTVASSGSASTGTSTTPTATTAPSTSTTTTAPTATTPAPATTTKDASAAGEAETTPSTTTTETEAPSVATEAPSTPTTAEAPVTENKCSRRK
ncbi:hypothetical protein BBO99_00002278 [Phytophthora kernoviae]|uniref:Uncharacterized protein n=2 Tax=Phytophthora kernoviae TaxID=325452 RepID=A0A3R7HLS0_9STRA|nr:hypothetical protein G195_002695 [Phytophthora kernoviae 00238/432]KAG2528669.1 hypothetical protein JM16_002584 [Phytophthora kernoviae]KAG2530480.1 hypothetical protein JM18_002106 [Phytophthora kernoviae]RLN10668.1 hypothetical protein BBI17_002189 [Phytophthora kernoviae]RLN83273.1 hypothetical protein BBO99_00002278 [Phytophthora kernoviae]